MSVIERSVKSVFVVEVSVIEKSIGSLRIDDFCTTTPLGYVIVPSRRSVEI